MSDNLPAIDIRDEARRTLADDLPPAAIEPQHVRTLVLALLARIEQLESRQAGSDDGR